MARKNQRLINYHTSGVTSMPLASEVSLGEIVVRHADEKPELLLKKNNGDFAVIPDSVAVASAISSAVTVSEGNINAAIAGVKESLSAHTIEFNTYKEDAAKEFATKEEVSGHVATLNSTIDSAKADVYASATTFATNAVSAATEELQGEIADVRAAINEANSGATEFEDFVKKNYATSADTVSAISAAKDEAIASASAYTDAEIVEVYASATSFATNAVSVAKTELQGQIDDVVADVADNAKAIEDAAKHVAETYATSARTVDAIAVAKGEAISAATANTKSVGDAVYASATSYADSAVSAATEELQGQIDDVAEDVESAVSALTAVIEENELTTANAFNKFKESAGFNENGESVLDGGKSLTQGILDAEAHIVEVYGSATSYADSAVSSAKSELQGNIDDLESALNSGITSVRSEMSAATDNLTELINNKVSVAYRYKGSCAYADLPASGEVIGEVWNVTDANGDFPAGTNYAWDGEKWDALGGSVDLSPYAKVADFNKYKEEVKGEFADVRSEISDANSGVSILEAYVKDTYATSADTEAAIAVAKGEAIAAASAFTKAREEAVYASATSYADSAVSSAKSELQGNINGVSSNLNTLSGSVVDVKATADSAIQTASIVDAEACKVSVEKDGTELKFDFSNLVIDCGEF